LIHLFVYVSFKRTPPSPAGYDLGAAFRLLETQSLDRAIGSRKRRGYRPNTGTGSQPGALYSFPHVLESSSDTARNVGEHHREAGSATPNSGAGGQRAGTPCTATFTRGYGVCRIPSARQQQFASEFTHELWARTRRQKPRCNASAGARADAESGQSAD